MRKSEEPTRDEVVNPDWETVELIVSWVRVTFVTAQEWREPWKPSVRVVAPGLQCVIQNRGNNQRHRWARSKHGVYNVIELQKDILDAKVQE